MRARAAGLAGVVLGLVLIAAAAGASTTRSARAGLAPVDARVVRQIHADGETTFWVVMRGRANLSKARGIPNWAERGRYVYERLVHEADADQSGIRGQLQKLGVPFQSFWIANVVEVTAGEDVLKLLASDPQVERIVPDTVFHVDRPRAARAAARAAATEWNIDNIKAPQVWSTYGDTGQGIVIASIDTGVQFDHPALVTHYRGYLGPGQYDHNYNWYDPASVCGSPSTTPCDNVFHGTHTMGTMVGDDGAGNQVGVAPGAKWITAKGCESNSCSTTALVSAGQWLVAPTDLNGQNPRPDLRPNIISNSWGDGPGNTFYQQVVDSWVAAGIFPAFANGNSGPTCGSAGSPGDYLNAYAVGAYDSSNAIASFSSRGPSAFSSETKPNISAPGVNVRSSVPTNTYASYSGTSMATPHVAAAVALVWSAAPSLIGQIDQTRQLLDSTAMDSSDTTCGGTGADNDVFGEGRLDAYAAVTAAPRGATGTLAGNVTPSGSNTPIAGAEIDISSGSTSRTTFTDANGHYQLILTVANNYAVTAKAFGRVTQTANGVAVNQGATTTQNFALAASPSHSISGHVRDGSGNPIANATVTIQNTPIAPTTSDATGSYSFANVPDGTYDLLGTAGHCTGSQTQHLVLSANAVLDFSLPAKTDGTYTCSIQNASYISASNPIALTGDDASALVTLPAPFTYYGTAYNSVNVSTNGLLDFAGADTTWSNGSIPSGSTPNNSIYPYWDDLYFDGAVSVRTSTLTSPNRFVIEWNNPDYFGDSTRRVNFEVVLNLDTGQILFQYGGLGSDARKQGNSTTVGIENATGSAGIQYSYNEAALSDTQAILFSPASVPTVTTSTLPDGTRTQAYVGAALAATGGTPPYTWSLAAGSLPTGLNLSTGGSISGTVGAGATLGANAFTVRVSDSASHTATQALSIDVRDPLSVTTTSLPGGTVGTAYSQSVAASGGKTSYTWSLFGGSLPPGLTLGGDGTISGTPTTAGGPYGFTVQVRDSGNPQRTATKALSITIGSSAPVPGAPTTLTAGAARGKGIQLSWTAAAPNGSPVTGYKVYRSTSSGTETLLTTLGNVLSYKDSATTRGQRYYYKVSAVNGNGEGPPSPEASQVAK